MMITKQLIFAGCATMVLSVATAQAGPCNTGGKDAGSGPTPGSTGQTTGIGSAAKTDQHPPTETMNQMTGQKAASSQDAQRQQQGQPTAAQQAEGAVSSPAQGAAPSAKMADQGC